MTWGEAFFCVMGVFFIALAAAAAVFGVGALLLITNIRRPWIAWLWIVASSVALATVAMRVFS